MFTINLMKNTSATNVVDKEVTQVSQGTGALKQGCSISDPVIMFETDDNSIWPRSTNYMYIEEFGRYYYVTNIISVHMNLWEVHGHVDVLMSFKEAIRAQTAIVARQESQYNLYLDDGIFMTYQNPKIQTKFFSNPTPFETQEFVLIVAGS